MFCTSCKDKYNSASGSNSSEAKYDAGTGWPSFSEAHGTWEKDESHANIVRRPDNSLGSTGTEVICKHVSTGQNYVSQLGYFIGNGNIQCNE